MVTLIWVGGENVFKDVNLTSVLNTTALDKDEKCAYVFNEGITAFLQGIQ